MARSALERPRGGQRLARAALGHIGAFANVEPGEYDVVFAPRRGLHAGIGAGGDPKVARKAAR